MLMDDATTPYDAISASLKARATGFATKLLCLAATIEELAFAGSGC
jgi:hypothetical protein